MFEPLRPTDRARERQGGDRSVRSAKAVALLGQDAPLRFSQTGEGLTIALPPAAPRQPANVYRIDL